MSGFPSSDMETQARQCLRNGQAQQAAVMFADLVRANPHSAQLWHDLGVAYMLQNQPAQAEGPLRKALALEPHYIDALANLGGTLIELSRYGEAVALFQHALALKPNFVPMLNNLGRALNRQGRSVEAMPYFQQALTQEPNSVEVLHNFGIALSNQGKFEEAIEVYQKVVRLRPNHYFTYNSLGNCLRNSGKLLKAVTMYEQALVYRPDYPEAHLGRALAWLSLGDFAKGWPEYEWRLRFKEYNSTAIAAQRWDGAPLAGRTILLLADQGLGDVIQFVRFGPLLKALGARVLQECPVPLVPLFASFTGFDQIVPRGSPLPSFDCYAALASLPGIFRMKLEDIPAKVPYLFADPRLIEHWKAELASRERERPEKPFRIGLAWQGEPRNAEDRRRSFPLRLLEPIARVPGVQLVSLQKGFGAEQIHTCGFPVLDFGAKLDESHGPFMDTAAIMRNLDLIITADTAAAHLAGALGVPVWIPLTFVPDWRWLMEREDSPWYPTARLFRQLRRGDWEDVFQRMAKELRKHFATSMISINVSPGELLDRIVFLEFKAAKTTCIGEDADIRAELAELQAVRARTTPMSAAAENLVNELRAVHQKLWQLERDIRGMEQRNELGPEFVERMCESLREHSRRADLRARLEHAFS